MRCCSHPFTGPGYTLVLISLVLFVKGTDKFIITSVTVKPSVVHPSMLPALRRQKQNGGCRLKTGLEWTVSGQPRLNNEIVSQKERTKPHKAKKLKLEIEWSDCFH